MWGLLRRDAGADRCAAQRQQIDLGWRTDPHRDRADTDAPRHVEEGLFAAVRAGDIASAETGDIEVAAGEHAARMAAMDNATNACGDIIRELTQLYNKARQAAITGDLMDIVGGAEALKG